MDSTPILRVDKQGLLTTIQDQGRYGCQKDGIPVVGAMDTFASQVANVLAGNPRSEAVLELTLLGPTLTVLHDITACLCGADLSARVDDGPLPLWRSVRLYAGQVVQFIKPRSGARAYLAVAGGFDVPVVLGSKSTYLAGGLGGFEGRSLQSGDILRGRPNVARGNGAVGLTDADIPVYGQSGVVRAIPGPQLDAFPPYTVATFLSSEYEVTPQSDRMGYRLTGPSLAHASSSAADILSEAVPFGAIQVPADGQPIILMADRPTTGGYAKIGTVISVDLPRLAQMSPGARITFQFIDLEEAQVLVVAREQQLRLWEAVVLGRRPFRK